jgi:hypothetical protein
MSFIVAMTLSVIVVPHVVQVTSKPFYVFRQEDAPVSKAKSRFGDLAACQ